MSAIKYYNNVREPCSEHVYWSGKNGTINLKILIKWTLIVAANPKRSSVCPSVGGLSIEKVIIAVVVFLHLLLFCSTNSTQSTVISHHDIGCCPERLLIFLCAKIMLL